MLPSLLCAALLGTAPDAPREPPPAVSTESTTHAAVKTRAPFFATLGATLALSGTAIWLVSNVRQGTVAGQGLNPAELEVARWRLAQAQLGGAGLALVGACSVGVAAVLWSWDAERPVSAAPLLVPHGGGVSFAGRFP